MTFSVLDKFVIKGYGEASLVENISSYGTDTRIVITFSELFFYSLDSRIICVNSSGVFAIHFLFCFFSSEKHYQLKFFRNTL